MLAVILAFFLLDFAIPQVQDSAGVLVVEAAATPPERACPICGRHATRVHSRYTRHPCDLPVSDRPVRLLLHVRRFFCDDHQCPRRTFVERLPDLAPVGARRTARLTHALRAIGFASGGEAGARLASHLRMPTSGDTLLRILRATPVPPVPPPTVIGIDDFALRKGRRYGTIVVDMERHRPVDLLPDRTAETVAAWLRARPALTVVARDRSPEYARGVSAGAPQATQVADRFHLLGSLREAITRYLQRVRAALRRHLLGPNDQERAAATPLEVEAPPFPGFDPGPGRRARQAARHADRERRFQQVKAAHARGLSLVQIARETGLSIKTVRLWVRVDTLPPERRGGRRGGKVTPYGPYLLRRLAEGCTNQRRLWQEITAQGFVGTRSLVSKWIRAQRQALPAPATTVCPTLPGPQQLAWLVLRAHDATLAEEDHLLWERLRGYEELAWVQERAAEFTAMVRERQLAALDPWLAACRAGPVPELCNFADSVSKDGAAVRAALTLPWSTGPVEGHIHKLKLIKRSAYGRMKLDLLRLRVLHAA
jgi:transposase